ncbi:hypothetical protein V5O48_004709 [Marasmius crinis-equi]|uniref:DRBM domain-containing protein n=1 Tax=Marasmius crinis-equi TaxID=585013 RepID=A0ABR3FPA9_9AGAR
MATRAYDRILSSFYLSHDVKADYRNALNNYAQGAGMTVQYTESPTGPPQAPTWRATVYINGTAYGNGEGGTKDIAKEQAARVAWTYITNSQQ